MFSIFNKKLKYKPKITKDEYCDSSKCKLSSKLTDNLNMVRDILANCDDLVIREFNINDDRKTSAAIIFLSEMVSKVIINENVLKPLIYESSNTKDNFTINCIDIISKSIITAGKTIKLNTIEESIGECLSGNTILFVDGLNESLIIGTKEGSQRNIEEPKTEVVVRGPREGFCEDLSTNITLLRRKIINPEFKLR